MSYKIKITYDASKVEPNVNDDRAVTEICDIFTPGNCAANMEVFEGTPYHNNTPGNRGYGENALEDYVAAQVSHPGIVAAVQKAIETGEYTYETDVPFADVFVEGIGKALKGFGITVEVDNGAADAPAQAEGN